MRFSFKFHFTFLLLCMISISVISCKQNKNPCNLPASVLADLDKLDSLVKVPELRERDSIWNASNYKEAPVLSAHNETYRLTWSSSFGEAKICRIERKQLNYFYYQKHVVINEYVICEFT